jgi:hypothetical protein
MRPSVFRRVIGTPGKDVAPDFLVKPRIFGTVWLFDNRTAGAKGSGKTFAPAVHVGDTAAVAASKPDVD